MSKQITEMLKGTLEGIVLAILSVRSAYGYEITAWLREQGFSDISGRTIIHREVDEDEDHDNDRPRRPGRHLRKPD